MKAIAIILLALLLLVVLFIFLVGCATLILMTHRIPDVEGDTDNENNLNE